MGTALENLKALREQVAIAEAAAKEELAASKKEDVTAILAHMAENDITIADLQHGARIAGSKYNNGTDTYSGKGKEPKWFAAIPKEQRDQYLTKKPEAAAT